MDKILICKNSNSIIISKNGKKLIINKNENSKLFSQLQDFTKEKIIEWYNNR